MFENDFELDDFKFHHLRFHQFIEDLFIVGIGGSTPGYTPDK